MSKEPPKIYLSYSHQDTPWIEEFLTSLREGGVEASVEPPYSYGDSWVAEIEKALRESSIFILLLTENSLMSPWTLFELGAAMGGKKKIIPVVLRNVDIAKLPIMVKRFNVLKAESPKMAGEQVAHLIEQSKSES
jgi:hypothetical protein